MVERIREILSGRLLTPTQFADAIGVARPIVSHILSGRNKPSLEVVQKIIGAFPDLSLPWLLSGTGPMVATAIPGPQATPSTAVTVAPAEAPTKAAVVRTEPPVAAAAPPTAGGTPIAPVAFARPASSDTTEKAQPGQAVVQPVAGLSAPLQPQNQEYIAASRPAPATPEPAAIPPVALPAVLPEPPKQAAEPLVTALAAPGKAIRRIVIFYQDGTFSDFQPEGPQV